MMPKWCQWGSGGTPGRIWRAVVSKDPWRLLASLLFDRFWSQNGNPKGNQNASKNRSKNNEFSDDFLDGFWVPK